MFIRIKENKLYDWAGYKYAEDCQEIDIDYSTFEPEKYAVIEGVLTDISSTPEYIAEQAAKEAEEQARKNITKRQMLIWLFLNKQKTEQDILNAINTIQDDAQKYLALVNYSGTNNFYYGNDFVPLIGQALGLTENELKQCFDEAGNL